jgi:hypothetical protein
VYVYREINKVCTLMRQVNAFIYKVVDTEQVYGKTQEN